MASVPRVADFCGRPTSARPERPFSSERLARIDAAITRGKEPNPTPLNRTVLREQRHPKRWHDYKNSP